MIYIITPCSRPKNLSFIKNSIPSECNWIIVYDNLVREKPNIERATILHSPYTGYFGNLNRNYALDNIKFSDLDWIYILDDDNIIHPQWYSVVKDVIDEKLNMIAWGQVWKNNDIRLKPTQSPMIGNIDTSCYMIRGRLMKTLRYKMDYAADGIMAREAFLQDGFLMLNQYLGYYNYLRTPINKNLTNYN